VYLKKLELINFRNYSKLNLNFSKGVILVVGDNGQGKTNLLESIYYLSTGKSHRSYNHNELIKWKKDFSILRAEVSSESAKKIEHLIEIELKENNIKIRVDKAYCKRKSEFISILPSVIFSPDDLRIIKSSPSNRRNFIDSILDQIHNDFYRIRLQYQKILNQRNSLIKSISSSMKISDNKNY
jgi:DNA replication and repair protein RecF